MKRLFYTDEKSENRIFHRILGWQPSYGWLLLDYITQEVIVFLDGRYFDMYIEKNPDFTIKKTILNDRISQVLIPYVSVGETICLEKTLSRGIVDGLQHTDLDVQRLFEETSWQFGKRVCKSPEAIQYTKEAIHKTQEIWEWIESMAISGVLVGVTELELRGKIIQKAFSLGCEDEAFPTIVASGKHSALPHHYTSTMQIQEGPLLIDMGFRWHGWCSDFTRVVWVGSNDSAQGISRQEFEKITHIVQQAHNTALALVSPGVACKDISLAARKIIEDAGYGEYFTHSLGHGVGLDIHESPGVSIRSKDTIEKGMIFTIEPGIYLPEKFGVRWENIVIIE